MILSNELRFAIGKYNRRKYEESNRNVKYFWGFGYINQEIICIQKYCITRKGFFVDAISGDIPVNDKVKDILYS